MLMSLVKALKQRLKTQHLASSDGVAPHFTQISPMLNRSLLFMLLFSLSCSTGCKDRRALYSELRSETGEECEMPCSCESSCMNSRVTLAGVGGTSQGLCSALKPCGEPVTHLCAHGCAPTPEDGSCELAKRAIQDNEWSAFCAPSPAIQSDTAPNAKSDF